MCRHRFCTDSASAPWLSQPSVSEKAKVNSAAAGKKKKAFALLCVQRHAVPQLLQSGSVWGLSFALLIPLCTDAGAFAAC